MKNKIVRIIEVEGDGDFPIDMLRYAECIPATEVDSRKIQAQSGLLGTSLEKARIRLRKTESSAKTWYEARWQSFGWKVVAYDKIDFTRE